MKTPEEIEKSSSKTTEVVLLVNKSTDDIQENVDSNKENNKIAHSQNQLIVKNTEMSTFKASNTIIRTDLNTFVKNNLRESNKRKAEKLKTGHSTMPLFHSASLKYLKAAQNADQNAANVLIRLKDSVAASALISLKDSAPIESSKVQPEQTKGKKTIKKTKEKKKMKK